MPRAAGGDPDKARRRAKETDPGPPCRVVSPRMNVVVHVQCACSCIAQPIWPCGLRFMHCMEPCVPHDDGGAAPASVWTVEATSLDPAWEPLAARCSFFLLHVAAYIKLHLHWQHVKSGSR